MKVISIILLITMIFYSCSSTRLIKHDPSTYEDVNDVFAEKRVQITLINGEIIIAENLIVQADSSSWVEIKIKESEYGSVYDEWYEVGESTVPNIFIKSIKVSSSGEGAANGLIYGFLSGIALGLVTSFVWAVQGQSFMGGKWDAVKSIKWMLFTGGVGALVGLPVGLIVGGTQEYVFIDSVQTGENN